MNKVERYKKIELISIILLMDNLPVSMTSLWLWQLCKQEGDVVDVFVSRNTTKNVSIRGNFFFI